MFRKDRLTGELALVSVTGDGKPANGNSYGARISDDGKRVVFVSYATNLDTSAPGGERYAYLRDLDAQTTALSSRGQGQVGEPGPANDVAISGNGQTVVFTTAARMQLEDKNGAQDVYARRAGDTILVSRATGAAAPLNAGSIEPSVNYDGTRVAFGASGKLSDKDTNGVRDVYRRNLAAATTDLISARDSDGSAGDRESWQPAISATGDAVAYTSRASDLDAQHPSDGQGSPDVLVRIGGDQRELSRASSSRRAGRPGAPTSAAISRAPCAVAFTASEPTAIPSDPDYQVVVRDPVSMSVQVASRAGVAGPPGDSWSDSPSISESGSVVSFSTGAQNLGGGIGGDAGDVAARDLAAGTTSLVSAPASGPLADDLDFIQVLSGKGQLTPDARFAVFEASHDGLGLADRGSHVFLRDVRTGTTIVADRADGPSGSPAHDAWAPSASADGRLVAFRDRLAPGAGRHEHVRRHLRPRRLPRTRPGS